MKTGSGSRINYTGWFKIIIIPLSIIFLGAAASPFLSDTSNSNLSASGTRMQIGSVNIMRLQDENTGTPSSTDVLAQTETPTPTNTDLETLTPSDTEPDTATSTNTESLTDIPTASITATTENTETPTETPTLTETETVTPTPTETETGTATDTPPTDGIVILGRQMRMGINPMTTPTPTTYPFQCLGANVVQPLLGDSDMVARTAQSLGDINGDGKPEIGIDASSSASPYKEMEIFSGEGYGYWGYFFTSADPQMHPDRIIGLGDIYGGDKVGEFGEQLVTYGLIRIFSSYNNTGFVNVQTVQDPGSLMSYAFQSLGDINNDEYPSFAIVEGQSIIVYAGTPPYGTTPYIKLYTIALSDYPSGSIVGLPDIDGDGVRDFAVGVRNSYSTSGYVIIYSGATGNVINRIYGQQTEYLGRSLTSIGDANGDGAPDLLIGGSYQGNYYIKQYSLTNAGLEPKLIQQFNGGYQAAAVTGAVKPGEADWIFKRLMTNSTRQYYEMDLISTQGTVVASCTPASGLDFSGMSAASTDDVNGETQFVLTLPKSNQAFVFEYLATKISLVSPANWIMAQSLRPTFQWNSSGDAYRYRLEIHRTDDQGKALNSVFHNVELMASNTCPPTGGICLFKPDIPSYENSSDRAFELPSGTKLSTGGYAWKIYSEDALGNTTSQSDYEYFQIPSLGGTWDDVRQMCNEPPGHASAPCISGDLNYENIYWNQYDDRIYRYAEQWDVPPSLLKAIMIGETATAIDSVGLDGFPPTRAYGFEPLLDCQFYIINGVKKEIYPILQYSQPYEPSESFCFTDKCRSPYDLIEKYNANLRISIYDFVYNSGFEISDKAVFDKNRQITGCDVQSNSNLAQYRTSASYGLGQVLYINDFQGLSALAQQTYGNSVPNPIPPEWLYDPEFNINAMGNNLNKKRCACQNTLGADSNTNLNDWIADVAAYNGWGQCGYGGTVLYRATKYTSPKSLEQGVDTILRENTSHVCDESLDKYANCPAYNSCLSNSNLTSSLFITSTSSISFALSQDRSNQHIIATQNIDTKSNLGVVRVDLVIQEDWINVGWVKIYSDAQGTNLLWQSDLLPDILPSAWIDTAEINGQPIILAYWGERAHSTRIYPIMYDGNTFHIVDTHDDIGNSVFIEADGGALTHDYNGYLVAFSRNFNAPANSMVGTVWAFDGKKFNVVRRYVFLPNGSDQTRPTSSHILSEQPNGNGWYAVPPQITINATDDQAVDSIYYSLQNGISTTEYKIPMDNVTFPLGEGRWTLQYMAIDASNHKETMHSILVLVDKTPPTINYQINGSSSNNGWYPAGTSLSFTASDPNLADGSIGSGINKIEYSRDGGTTWYQYSNPIQFTSADYGTQNILYRASDLAGNKSPANSTTLKIDAQPPTGTVKANPITLWPPNGKLDNVVLTGTALDGQSGVSNVKIDVLDPYGEWVPATINLQANGVNNYSWQATIQLPASRKGTDKNGRVYIIRITIIDMAGNTTVVQTTVTVPHDQG